MDDKTRLEILDYWISHQEELEGMPPKLKHKITEDELDSFVSEIETKQNSLDIPDIINYKDKLLDKIQKEREIKLLEVTTKSNLTLTKATIFMAFVSVVALFVSIYQTNISSEQLTFQYQNEISDLKAKEPMLSFYTPPCTPFPIQIGSEGTELLGGSFTLENIGVYPLGFEFEIKTDFAKFKLINESDCDFSIPCCLKYSEKCNFKKMQQTPVLLANRPRTFEYDVFIPGIERTTFNYSIIVRNIFKNTSTSILSCTYNYSDTLNFGGRVITGYTPINIQ